MNESRNGITFSKVPQALANLPNWVVWKSVSRDGGKPTKVPRMPNDKAADATDPTTWSMFEQVEAADHLGNFSGIGFVFFERGGFVGIDLDGCRCPQTGRVAEWAREIIKRFGSYAEVSPSKTGVKIFVAGVSPFEDGKGRKKAVDGELICEKAPAIEIYDRERYFAVTGWRLAGVAHEPILNDEALAWLKETYWPRVVASAVQSSDFHSDAAVIERARKYLAKIPGAVSGQNGHDATFHVACVLVLDFGLPLSEARALLGEWNHNCEPAWSDKELDHKIDSANEQPGERGRLRNAAPQRWSAIPVPTRKAPPPKTEPTITTLADVGRLYIDALRRGDTELIKLGLGAVDDALAGGVARGEYVAMAARPSHGKSMVGLQVVHQWAANKVPCFVASAEMSKLAMGKRVLHFNSDLPESEWKFNTDKLEEEIAYYERMSAKSLMTDECDSADEVVRQIEKAIDEHGIQAAVVDYVQLLKAPGNGKPEQVSYSSGVLKSLAKRRGITLVLLCQLGRAIDKRPQFKPVNSDIEHSGRIEQDADVILHLVWPWKINATHPKNVYQIFVGKNRNREIVRHFVECRLLPNRQMVTGMPGAPAGTGTAFASTFEGEFDEWNQRKDIA